MKSFFEENEEYTEDAKRISIEFGKIVRDFLNKEELSEYLGRELELILCGEVKHETLRLILERKTGRKIR